MRTIFTLLAFLVSGGAVAGEPPELKFLRAHIDEPHVLVQVPEDVDWEAEAPRQRSQAIGDLPRATDMYGQYALVEFERPKPEFIDDYHYYLISADGVTGLTPLGLRGAVTHRWDHLEPAGPPQTSYRGSLAARPHSLLPTATGGIVIASRGPCELELAETGAQLLEVLHAKNGCEHTAEEHADERLEDVRLVRKAELRVNGGTGRYLFFAWSPHHTCTADEPNYYFSIVDAADPTRRVGFSASVWPASD